MKVVLATGSGHKLREFKELLAGSGLELVPWKDGITVEEDGASFAENARKKARAWAEGTGMPALADDSGLCVDALDGAPGIRSARYAPGNDADRVRALLGALEGHRERRARFVCAVCLAWPDGRLLEASGEVTGEILEAPEGTGGFGYDPVFLVPELGATFAEVPSDRKHEFSHRARATRGLLAMLDA